MAIAPDANKTVNGTCVTRLWAVVGREVKCQNLEGEMGVQIVPKDNFYKGQVVVVGFQVLQKPWRAGWTSTCHPEQAYSTRNCKGLPEKSCFLSFLEYQPSEWFHVKLRKKVPQGGEMVITKIL